METVNTQDRTLLTIDDLIEMAFNLPPTQIAQLDLILRDARFTKLANAVRRQGINNCGSDYAEYYNQATSRA